MQPSSGKYCISGGGGYLGQSLAQSLQCDHFVVLLDIRFDTFPHIHLDSERGSVLDRTSVREAIHGCTGFFHIAAYGMSGGAMLDREKCFSVNVDGTKLVLEECLNSQTVRNFVYTSSVVVIFGGRELDFADENTPYLSKFKSAYAESKCIAEQLVCAASCPQFRTCVLRLRALYGPGECRMLRRSIDAISRGLVRATFPKAADRCWTQYLSCGNAVHALIQTDRTLQMADSPANGQVYHILDDGVVNSFEFWRPMFEALGHRFPTFRIPFWIVYAIAYLCELFYRWFGVEPWVTRTEVDLVGVANTFSIESAKRELQYRPRDSHNLEQTILHMNQNQQCKLGGSSTRKQIEHL